ncbi:hypothetical protein [Thermoplasma volcanium GSS1]|uniref:DUF998 domain-containing protein n=1 Tax=Thermoplasma volcanium (strain ATCC 51530 / DSM 4299 / JCM 9571 / NBRC 15438 / GSS1) TaxID=273116 RepID=Q97AI7_THEVO|nr:DUF998 domain-containing protein [Thermoplasma volcanium]BAB59965.1 hypothetical protein [Thermoplasma volcanium GSS1]
MASNKYISYFSLAGIVGPIFAISLVFIDVAVSPWFTWQHNALSDLGVHPYGYLFNLGIIVEGFLNVLFVMALFEIGLKKRIGALLIISGIALALVGVFNEDHPPYHLIFALIYFLLFPIGIIVASIPRLFPFYVKLYSMLASILSLIDIFIGIGFVFKFISIKNVGLSIPEIIEALLLGSWSVLVSVYAFRKLRINR